MSKASSAAKLERTTFSSSRLLEYFTARELEMQIGCAPEKWPLALTKELIDNSLDACETWTGAPDITVTVDGSSIAVADNGPGLPEDTLIKSLDYATRTSDKSHYISPSRGQLGNALKCLWAGPFVYNGLLGHEERGTVEVTTTQYALKIIVSVDKIAQAPMLQVIPLDRAFVKTGTIIKTEWPNQACYIQDESEDFYRFEENEKTQKHPETFTSQILELLQSYATFNPHASFSFRCNDQNLDLIPISRGWQKWGIDSPTSPHWYSAEDLRGLIAAYISNGNGNKTIRSLVSEFRGLSSSAKQMRVVARAGLTGKCLDDLLCEGAIDLIKVEELRQAMCAASQPVRASRLGRIGEEALVKRIVEIDGVVPETVRYVKKFVNDVVRPMGVEVVFGLRAENRGETRIRFGLNFSPALNIPIRSLPAWLQYDALIDPHDAACLTVHATCPRFEFTSRSKSMLV